MGKLMSVALEETKELKRRVRDVLQPERGLGHVDRGATSASKDETDVAVPSTADTHNKIAQTTKTLTTGSADCDSGTC